MDNAVGEQHYLGVWLAVPHILCRGYKGAVAGRCLSGPVAVLWSVEQRKRCADYAFEKRAFGSDTGENPHPHQHCEEVL